MSKILAQTGVSLADVYDIEGSIAGVDKLSSDEVILVHEMGATIFSERIAGRIIRLDSGVVNQNDTWDIQSTGLPATPFRILGVTVFADVGSRVNHTTLSLRVSQDDQEMPIWVYNQDCGSCGVTTSRFQDDGQLLAQHNILTPVAGVTNFPTMMFGNTARIGDQIPTLAWRGNASGFGAGDVEAIALIQIAFAIDAGGLSSKGLPLPSW